MTNNYRQAIRLSNVPRWVTIPTIQQQNVAEHSYAVATIVHWLINGTNYIHFQNIMARKEFLQYALSYALFHDCFESVTGDLSAPFKKKIKSEHDEIEKFNTDYLIPDRGVKVTVKLADMLEACLFCRREELLGNQGLVEIERDVESNLEKSWIYFAQEHGVDQTEKTFDTFIGKFWANFDHTKHPVMEFDT